MEKTELITLYKNEGDRLICANHQGIKLTEYLNERGRVSFRHEVKR